MGGVGADIGGCGGDAGIVLVLAEDGGNAAIGIVSSGLVDGADGKACGAVIVVIREMGIAGAVVDPGTEGGNAAGVIIIPLELIGIGVAIGALGFDADKPAGEVVGIACLEEIDGIADKAEGAAVIILEGETVGGVAVKADAGDAVMAVVRISDGSAVAIGGVEQVKGAAGGIIGVGDQGTLADQNGGGKAESAVIEGVGGGGFSRVGMGEGLDAVMFVGVAVGNGDRQAGDSLGDGGDAVHGVVGVTGAEGVGLAGGLGPGQHAPGGIAEGGNLAQGIGGGGQAHSHNIKNPPPKGRKMAS